MFLPLLCMGMISPTIIQLRNLNVKGTGKTTGTIYAISTVGGILMTLLMGFYFQTHRTDVVMARTFNLDGPGISPNLLPGRRIGLHGRRGRLGI